MKTGLSLSNGGNTQILSAQPAVATVKLGPISHRRATLDFKSAWRDHLPAVLCALLLVIAILRISATYHVLSQAYDEPADVVTGMEWLDKGTYTLNLEHPPLSPVAAAVGPYLAGLRLQEVPVIQGPQGRFFDLTTGGNNILHSRANYWRALTLARLGILPFFVLGALVVFLWTRELVGGVAAVLAVLLFTTLPPILAFAGFVFTDLPVAVLVFASAFIFSHWIERPFLRRSLALGAVTALSVLANFPAVLYVPTCFAAVACGWYCFGQKSRFPWGKLLRQSLWATVAFFLVLWGGYRFSVQPLSSIYQRPAQDVASLHLPTPFKNLLQSTVAANPRVPAPSLIRGITAVVRDTGHGRQSYLLGHMRLGGWWYFYPVVLALKSPLPFLLLALLGSVAMARAGFQSHRWALFVPGLCVLALLLVTMPVKVDYGVRHILSIYVPLAVLAAYGGMQLWASESPWRWPARVTLIGLLGWQIVVTARVHPDYVTYMNELAGQHPENVLAWGCDYDCGQDTARLGLLLQQKKVPQVSLALFSSVDFQKLGFPPFHMLTPYEQACGWVAASAHMIRTGDAFWGGTHPDAFAWLSRCQPVARAGKTIYLYYLPCDGSESLNREIPQ